MAAPTLALRALVPSAAIESTALHPLTADDWGPSLRHVPVATWALLGLAAETRRELVGHLGAAVRQAALDRDTPVVRRLHIEQSGGEFARVHLQRGEWAPRCTLVAQFTTRSDAQHGETTQVTIFSETATWRQTKLGALQLAIASLFVPFLLHVATLVHVHWSAAPLLALMIVARLGGYWQQRLREDESFVIATLSGLLAPRMLTRAPMVGPFRTQVDG